jgi:DNA-binding winged helix-turn-helix (wHTH) protein
VRFVVAVDTAKLGAMFRALEADGFRIDVVTGELPDLDPRNRDVVFAPLPAESSGPGQKPDQLVAGDLFVDLESRQAHRAGRELRLGRREFDLLACFVRFANRLVSRDTLRSMVWGNEQVSVNTIEVHISSLRRKLDMDGETARERIHTVRGAGYVLRTPSPAPDPRREALDAERQRRLKQREAAVARREAVLLAERIEGGRGGRAPA